MRVLFFPAQIHDTPPAAENLNNFSGGGGLPVESFAALAGNNQGGFFPFAALPSSVLAEQSIPDSLFPVRPHLNLEKICKWFWRVKTWKIRVSLSLSGVFSRGSGYEDETYSADPDFELEVMEGSSYTSESDLLSTTSRIFYGESGPGFDESGIGYGTSMGLFIFNTPREVIDGQQETSQPRVVYHSPEEWSPCFFFQFAIWLRFDQVVAAYFRTPDLPFVGYGELPLAPIHLQVDSDNRADLYGQMFGGLTPLSDQSISGTLSVTPGSYWEYKRGESRAYDAATGRQLVSDRTLFDRSQFLARTMGA